MNWTAACFFVAVMLALTALFLAGTEDKRGWVFWALAFVSGTAGCLTL